MSFFWTSTQAGDHAIGAVMSQVGADTREHALTYGRRERYYCTTRKEMWVLVTFVKNYQDFQRFETLLCFVAQLGFKRISG